MWILLMKFKVFFKFLTPEHMLINMQRATILDGIEAQAISW